MSLKCYLYFSNCIRIHDCSNTECSPMDHLKSSCPLLMVCTSSSEKQWPDGHAGLIYSLTWFYIVYPWMLRLQPWDSHFLSNFAFSRIHTLEGPREVASPARGQIAQTAVIVSSRLEGLLGRAWCSLGWVVLPCQLSLLRTSSTDCWPSPSYGAVFPRNMWPWNCGGMRPNTALTPK